MNKFSCSLVHIWMTITDCQFYVIDSFSCEVKIFALPLKFFMLFYHLLIVLKINYFKKFFQNYHLSVKQIGSRLGPTIL